MSAARATPPSRLSLFRPTEAVSDGSVLPFEERDRTTNPVANAQSPTRETWEAEALLAVAAKTVPDEVRQDYAAKTTLPEFYQDCMGPRSRWDRIGRRTRKSSTGEKDVAALNHWVAATKPNEWPSGEVWLGPSLDFCSRASIDWYLDTLERFVTVGGLAATSVNGLGNSLRTILNHAVRVKAIVSVQKLPRIKEDRHDATIYTPQAIEKVVESLLRPTSLLGAGGYETSLAVAFLLACRIGARAGDLFRLTREDFSKDVRGRVTVRLHAVKNQQYEHKAQSIPVSPTMWAIVDRNCPASGLLFPLLTTSNSRCENPERSYAANQRTKRLKAVLAECGLERNWPWHSCRATCNETLEAIKTGVGQFVLGHSASGVNAKSYRNPTESVFQTVCAVTPLRCECRLAGTLVDVSDDTYCGIG